MALSQEICNSFKQELFTNTHTFTAGNATTFCMALLTTAATANAQTTAFTTTVGANEVSSSGSYTAGLTTTAEATKALTVATGVPYVTQTSATGGTAWVDFNNKSWTTATISARGAIIYNKSSSDKAVAVLDFGGTKTSTAGTFQVVFPSPTSSAAIIRIA